LIVHLFVPAGSSLLQTWLKNNVLGIYNLEFEHKVVLD
jgi:hypothetical protein